MAAKAGKFFNAPTAHSALPRLTLAATHMLLLSYANKQQWQRIFSPYIYTHRPESPLFFFFNQSKILRLKRQIELFKLVAGAFFSFFFYQLCDTVGELSHISL